MKKAAIVILVLVLIAVIGMEAFLFVEVKNLAGERGLSLAELFTAGPAAAVSAANTPEPKKESPILTPTPEPTATPEPTSTPEPTATAEPTPEPTAVPTQGPPPTMVPVTPTPEPTRRPAHSGSCSSETGTPMDILVDWSTEDLGGGTTRVTITGTVSSYSLNIGRTTVDVTLGDQTASYDIGRLRVGQNVETKTDLFKITMDVPTGGEYPLTVDWNFGATYSGVRLDKLTATDTVTT